MVQPSVSSSYRENRRRKVVARRAAAPPPERVAGAQSVPPYKAAQAGRPLLPSHALPQMLSDDARTGDILVIKYVFLVIVSFTTYHFYDF